MNAWHCGDEGAHSGHIQAYVYRHAPSTKRTENKIGRGWQEIRKEGESCTRTLCLCACGLHALECWASVHNSCPLETVATPIRHCFCHKAGNSSVQHSETVATWPIRKMCHCFWHKAPLSHMATLQGAQ